MWRIPSNSTREGDGIMVKIILIRHGETDWNREQIFRGRIDVALNEVGLAQAGAVKESLKDVKIDRIYSSPLSRAFETASVLGENRGLGVEIEKGFIDIDFGKWQDFHTKRSKKNIMVFMKPGLLNLIRLYFLKGRVLKMCANGRWRL